MVSLDTKPPYRALSYSWQEDPPLKIAFAKYGSQADINWRPAETWRTIICNGQGFIVGPNLYNALIWLRKTQGDYSLWIDAICINQNDLGERGSQVEMMGRIYKSAESVLVWLGTCPILLSPVMGGFGVSKNTNPRTITETEGQRLRAFAKLRIPAAYLFSRRWFRRGWVMQEVLLARQLEFFLGPHQFSSETLLDVIGSLGSAEELNYKYNPLIRLPNAFQILKSNQSILNSREEFSRGLTWQLEDYLFACCARGFTDRRDAVFAGLALLDPLSRKIGHHIQAPITTQATLNIDSGEPWSNRRNTSIDTAPCLYPTKKLWSELSPNYESSTVEVFINCAACLLSSPTGIYLLSLAGRAPPVSEFLRPQLEEHPDYSKDPSKDLPSWVPDFSRIPSPQPLRGYGGDPFTACLSIEEMPQISADTTKLRLHAANWDTLVGHSWYRSLFNTAISNSLTF